MYPLYFISKHNMKKKKGNIAVILFLIALAVLLLYVSISLLTSTGKVLDTIHEEVNAADWFAISPEENDQKMMKILETQEELETVEKNACLFFPGASYKKKGEKEEDSMPFLLERVEDERTIGQIPDNLTKETEDDSILLPYYMKAGHRFQTGDTLLLYLGDMEYAFTVKGFIEDPLFATVMNVSTNKCYISKKRYEEILDDSPAAQNPQYVYHKVRLKPGEDSVAFDEIMTARFNENSLKKGLAATSWEAMRGGDMMLSSIVMGIILVFSLLLILIALIIVQFSIHQFVEENMKNIGILQASGYTGRQLKWAGVLEMMEVALAGTLIGLTAGGVLTMPIGNIQSSIIGLSWNQPFDWQAASLAVVVIFVMVFLVSLSASRPYGKISVLQALRGGLATHSFRKNPLPLERAHLPVTTVLGIKSILYAKGKSVAVCMIVAVMGFTMAVSFGMLQNFVLDTTTLLKLTGIDVGTANANGTDLERIGEELIKHPEIEKILYEANANITISHGDKETSQTCDIWSEPDQLENEIVVEGRLPQYENEIVLTTMISKRVGAGVGDVVYVKGEGERKEYIVCGIDQKINNMGLKTMMNFDGADRMNGKVEPSGIYVYTKEGYTYEDIENYFSDYTDIEFSDGRKSVETILAPVSSGIEMLCIVFGSITIFVIILVVLLLVKTKLLRERRTYGIHKALGFTTGQLMFSTMMADIPIIVLGAAAGTAAAHLMADSIVALCLSFCGIRKGNVYMNPLFDLLTVLGITVTAVFAESIASLKIRKMEPVKLITEE